MAALLRAAHPLPAAAVTAITGALAVSTGRGSGAVAVVAAVAAGQLSVGWTNDYVDRERDRAVRRRDKPLATGAVSAGHVRTAAVVALGACVVLSALSGWRAALVHLGAVAAGLAYDVRLKGTLASVVPYVFAFAALPAFVTLGTADHPLPPGWAVLAGALLGAGAHLVNALPDLDDDARTGVRGLPQRLGRARSTAGGTVLLAAAAVVVAVGPDGSLSLLALCLTAAALLCAAAVALLRSPRRAWHAALATAACSVAALLARGGALLP